MNAATPSLIDQWRAESSARHRPLQASLELTFRCNERCSHCYIPEFRDDPARTLSLPQWERVLDELRSAGVLYLTLMGGEAMLNPLFSPISAAANRRGFFLAMITNGLKIDSAAAAEQLSALGFSHLTFSLYSLQADIHDGMTRVRGSHKRALQAIEWVRAAGIPVGINCLLTAANIDSFFAVEDWCLARGFRLRTDLTVTPKQNGDRSPTLLRPSEEQLRAHYRLRSSRWEKGLPQPSPDGAEDFVCNAGKGKCAVTPYGELLTCIEVRESLGSLVTHSFAELWQGAIAQRWRNIRVKQIKGQGPAASFCEHCPGISQHEMGDPHQATPYFARMAQIKREVHLEFQGKRADGAH